MIEAEQGETVCEALLRNDIDIEHACEMSCACTTCHVIVREGFESLAEADELEEDYLDKAWGKRRSHHHSCMHINPRLLSFELPNAIAGIFKGEIVIRFISLFVTNFC